MPEVNLSETAIALVEYFDSNNLQNCSILAEVLDKNSDAVAIACVSFCLSTDQRVGFDSDDNYWLAQGVFSQSVILGYPGFEKPIKSLESMICQKPLDTYREFWQNIESIVAPRMYSYLGKKPINNKELGIICLYGAKK